MRVWLASKLSMRYFLFLAAFIPIVAMAAGDLQFQRLLFTGDNANTNDNLSAIKSTIQDRRGFIWFAGENGLGRYDGNDIIIYQTDPADPRSLSGNFVWALAVDHDGVLWIGAGRGLNRYNAYSDDFDRFLNDKSANNSISNSHVTTLAVDQQNNLIIGTLHGLNILNSERTRFDVFYYASADGDSVETNHIREVFVDSKNRIWVGTHDRGLNLFDRNTGKFTAYVHDPENSASLIDNDVSAIEEDHLGRLWVGTFNGGLSRMNSDGKTFTHYVYDVADTGSLPSNNIADIHEDSRQNLWVAADHGGLALYVEAADSFRRFQHSVYDSTSLSSKHLHHIYEDNQGNLWIGMFPTGVNFLDQSAAVFTNFIHRPDDPNSLSNNSLLCIFEDSSGMLWIGTEGGLNAFDRTRNTFTRYLPGTPNSSDSNGLRHGAVLAIEEDVSGDLWVGTWSGGLHRFNKKTGKFINYYPDPNNPDSISNEFIWKISRDKDDNIWIATQAGGLNRYVRATDSFVHYQADANNPDAIISDQLWTLLEDRKGSLWVGTIDGLDRFDKNTQKFTHYLHNLHDPTSLSSNHIGALFEDSRGTLWVGTRDAGLNIFDSKTGQFQSLGVAEGLPSASISSIIEDNYGKVWVTTVNGIASIDVDTLAIKSYGRSHGLVSNNFNRDATFKGKDGKLYMGGIDGLSIFDPGEIVADSAPAPVVITDFSILNQSIVIGAGDGLLSRSITETDTLTLSYKHSMFSFDYALLSYRSPSANQYAYMLEGFDKNWHMVGNQRNATYTNIDPGDYIFKVKAANRDGVWNTKGASIAIKITPPPWRTGWAYFGYLLLLIGIIYLGSVYKTLRVKSDIYRSLSATDPLTGICNRAAVAQVTEKIFAQREIRNRLGLLMMDLDDFKIINDTRGHDAGDRILKDFATLISRNVRSGDTFARWGGEEFILLCANINHNDVLTLAEKIRHMIASHIFEKEHLPLNLTVSIGVAFVQPDETFDMAFKRADVALYDAKEKGRNCVSVAV